MSIQLSFNHKIDGLGSVINLLSVLKSIEDEIIFNTTPQYRWISDLTQVLHIKNVQFIYKEIEKSESISNCDTAKFFCNYPLVNNQRNTKSNRIGISFFKKKSHALPKKLLEERNFYPFNRYISTEEIEQLTNKLKKDGYEIVDLDVLKDDDKDFFPSFRELADLLSTCSGVITYEGGVSHFSHCLKIPVILFPQRSCCSFHTRSIETENPGVDFNKYDPVQMLQSIQLDPKTYFLSSIDELLTSDGNKIEKIINELENENGNNIFLSKEVLEVRHSRTYTRKGWPSLNSYKNLEFQLQIDKELFTLNMTSDVFNLQRKSTNELKIGGLVKTNFLN